MLVALRDGTRRPAADPPSESEILQIMEYAVGGGDGMAAYVPLLEEELAVRGEDRRAPAWRKDEIAPDGLASRW